MCCLTHHMTHFHEPKQRLTKADDRRNRGKKMRPNYNATTARNQHKNASKHTRTHRTRHTQLGRQSSGLAWWKCENSRDMASICTIFCVITLASRVWTLNGATNAHWIITTALALLLNIPMVLTFSPTNLYVYTIEFSLFYRIRDKQEGKKLWCVVCVCALVKAEKCVLVVSNKSRWNVGKVSNT